MSGDSKIGLQVGGIVRTGPLRKAAGSLSAPATVPPQTRGAADMLPSARLIGIANALAEQAAPVDASHVGALRSAIAAGDYAVDPALIARGMLRFHQSGGD